MHGRLAGRDVLNPNNPFAAAGNFARIFYSFGDIPVSTRDFSQAYRFASGLHGDFDTWGGNYQYNVDFTASQNDLQVEQRGRIYYPGLIQAVNTGAYNFTNPAANTDAVRNLISPVSIQNSRSQLVQLQASIAKDLFTLPGGPLALGLGGAVRYESLFNPSANDDANGAAFRYFTINPFGASGSRTINSFNFEIDAPVHSSARPDRRRPLRQLLDRSEQLLAEVRRAVEDHSATDLPHHLFAGLPDPEFRGILRGAVHGLHHGQRSCCLSGGARWSGQRQRDVLLHQLQPGPDDDQLDEPSAGNV